MNETKPKDKPAAKYLAAVGIDYDPAELRIEAGEPADDLPESVIKKLIREGAVRKADD